MSGSGGECFCFDEESWFLVSFSSCQIAVSHDGQIQYLPVRSKQQIVNTEELEAAAHSAVTGWLSKKTHRRCFINSLALSAEIMKLMILLFLFWECKIVFQEITTSSIHITIHWIKKYY